MIVEKPNQSLRHAARKVESFDRSLQNLEHRMRRVAMETRALGLAAPQVGVNLAAALVPLESGLTFVVNPQIVTRVYRVLSVESCLSIPGKEFLVVRHQDLFLTYQTVDGDFKEIAFSKNPEKVRVVEHEIDHLHGIMIDDFGFEKAGAQDNYYKNRGYKLTFEQVRIIVAERERLGITEQEYIKHMRYKK